MARAPRLTYGITPPKAAYDAERRARVARAQSERIAALPVDAVVVYDLQDESSRTDVERPFPFIETVDPLTYAHDDLNVEHRKIVYRSTAALSREALDDWLARADNLGASAVFVGAPSGRDRPLLSLRDAYARRTQVAPRLPLGGIAIAERHEHKGDEHERMLAKRDVGCGFFITQAVFNVVATKNMLSDLHYACLAREAQAPPVLVTLSPCGSLRTLEFMRWLGVHVPRWLENELRHCADVLDRSLDLIVDAFSELLGFAEDKRIPLGCNVESVSLSRAEIDASTELVHRIDALLDRTVSGLGHPSAPTPGPATPRP